MAKLGDLWVRLGLKKDDFSKGLKEAGSETRGFGDLVSSMSKGVKIAWAAVAAAVIKFSKDAVSMTQRWGDAWNNTMSGVRAAYGSFIRQISSGEGWDNLFTNMREAYRLAKQASEALDEIFERNTSYKYEEAVTRKEIAQLDLIRRDTSKTDEEREKAAKRIIELEQRLGNTKRQILQDEAQAQRDIFKSQTRMNDEEIDFLVRNYNQNREIITQARQYLADRREAQKAAGRAGAVSLTADLDGVAADMIASNAKKATDALDNLEASTSGAVKAVAEVLQKYDKSSDELVSNLAKAEIAVINVDAEVARASARASATLGSLRVKTSGDMIESPREGWNEYVSGIQTAARIAAAEAAQIAEAESEINEKYDEFVQKFRELKGLTGEIPSPEKPFRDFIEQTTKAAEASAENEKRIVNSIELMNTALSEGFSGACQEFADSLLGLGDLNAGAVFQALLTPLADLAIKEGEIILASGVAIKGLREALSKLDPIAGIAAGAALIAVGAAAKSGLAALAKSGAGSTAVSTAGDYGGGGTVAQSIKSEMTIYVTGKISGNDIEISGQRTVNDWSR